MIALIFLFKILTQNPIQDLIFHQNCMIGLLLKSKLVANTITWKAVDSTFSLSTWKLRRLFPNKDSISQGNRLDTVFAFTPKDLVYKSALSQEMPSNELGAFIRPLKEKRN